MVLLPLVLLLDATLVSGITPKLDGLRLAPSQLVPVDPDKANDNDKLTAVSIHCSDYFRRIDNHTLVLSLNDPSIHRIHIGLLLRVL